MKMVRPGFTFIVLLTAFSLLVSCNVEQSITLRPDLSGSLEMSGGAMDFAGTAFEDLAILGGFDSASDLYKDAVNQNRSGMEHREDITFFDVDLVSEHGWESRTEFTDLRLLLGSKEAGGIVDYSVNDGVSLLKLQFDRESSVQFSELIPLLENPAFSLFDPALTTGLSEEEYIQDILGFSFGADNIPAIRTATVSLRLEVPGSVLSVTGGRIESENTVLFEIPLTRLLVPEPPVNWQVSWY